MRRVRPAVVAVFRPADQTWWAARVDASALGDADSENRAMESYWQRRGAQVSVEQIRPPVLMISQSSPVLARGCATNSHYDNVDRASGNAHLDCAHGLVIDQIEAALQP